MNSNSRQQRNKSSYMASKRFGAPKQQHQTTDSTTTSQQQPKQPYTKLNGFAAPKQQSHSTDSSSFSSQKPPLARSTQGTKKSFSSNRPKGSHSRNPKSKSSPQTTHSSSSSSSSNVRGKSKDGGGVAPMDWSPRKGGPYFSARFLPIARTK